MNSIELKFKYVAKKGTEKERKHIDVFINNIYVGYIISEVENKFVSDNWYFVYNYEFTTFKNIPKEIKQKGSISSKTKKELLIFLEQL